MINQNETEQHTPASPAQAAEVPSIDTPEFRALLESYCDADFGAEMGYGSAPAAKESRFAKLIAYINRHIAAQAPAGRDAWQPIETAPHDTMLLLAAEFDGPGDWRIKVGGFWNSDWKVYGASWVPTRWMPLPAAPSASPAESNSQGGEHA